MLHSRMVIIGRAISIFGLCLGAAFACAFVFRILLQVSLPPTDLDYGPLSVSALRFNEWFLKEAVYGGVLFGCLSFPFVYFSVRNLRLLTTTPFVWH